MSIRLSNSLRLSAPGRYLHRCPGCGSVHAFYTKDFYEPDDPGPRWSYNGDAERPTFSPSMLITQDVPAVSHDELKAIVERRRAGETVEIPYRRETRCHYFLTDGKLQFCGDSPHALAGQTVDLPEWYGGE